MLGYRFSEQLFKYPDVTSKIEPMRLLDTAFNYFAVFGRLGHIYPEVPKPSTRRPAKLSDG
jgi:hypothetical protein